MPGGPLIRSVQTSKVTAANFGWSCDFAASTGNPIQSDRRIEWDIWLKNYWERKAAGEKNIGIQPEELE